MSILRKVLCAFAAVALLSTSALASAQADEALDTSPTETAVVQVDEAPAAPEPVIEPEPVVEVEESPVVNTEPEPTVKDEPVTSEVVEEVAPAAPEPTEVVAAKPKETTASSQEEADKPEPKQPETVNDVVDVVKQEEVPPARVADAYTAIGVCRDGVEGVLFSGRHDTDYYVRFVVAGVGITPYDFSVFPGSEDWFVRPLDPANKELTFTTWLYLDSTAELLVYDVIVTHRTGDCPEEPAPVVEAADIYTATSVCRDGVEGVLYAPRATNTEYLGQFLVVGEVETRPYEFLIFPGSESVFVRPIDPTDKTLSFEVMISVDETGERISDPFNLEVVTHRTGDCPEDPEEPVVPDLEEFVSLGQINDCFATLYLNGEGVEPEVYTVNGDPAYAKLTEVSSSQQFTSVNPDQPVQFRVVVGEYEYVFDVSLPCNPEEEPGDLSPVFIDWDEDDRVIRAANPEDNPTVPVVFRDKDDNEIGRIILGPGQSGEFVTEECSVVVGIVVERSVDGAISTDELYWGELELEGNCPVAEPSPDPTPTPTPSPDPSPKPTVPTSPEPSENPTVTPKPDPTIKPSPSGQPSAGDSGSKDKPAGLPSTGVSQVPGGGNGTPAPVALVSLAILERKFKLTV